MGIRPAAEEPLAGDHGAEEVVREGGVGEFDEPDREVERDGGRVRGGVGGARPGVVGEDPGRGFVFEADRFDDQRFAGEDGRGGEDGEEGAFHGVGAS